MKDLLLIGDSISAVIPHLELDEIPEYKEDLHTLEPVGI